MCTEIYMGTVDHSIDLTLEDSPSGLWIHPVPPGPRVQRALIELDSVYEIGSFMGCSCGLVFRDSFKDDPAENYGQRVANVRELQEILCEHSTHIVRIMTLLDYNICSLEKFPRLMLDLDQMRDAKEFDFESDCVYEIGSGRHR